VAEAGALAADSTSGTECCWFDPFNFKDSIIRVSWKGESKMHGASFFLVTPTISPVLDYAAVHGGQSEIFLCERNVTTRCMRKGCLLPDCNSIFRGSRFSCQAHRVSEAIALKVPRFFYARKEFSRKQRLSKPIVQIAVAREFSRGIGHL
jgi:hypothetical protein